MKLDHWNVNHVTAHQLAKEALAIMEEYALIEEFPLCIYDIILVERCT
jgi:hypothetical protein